MAMLTLLISFVMAKPNSIIQGGILKRINMERLSQNMVKFLGDKKTDKITFIF
jgi:hypothetical protein